MADKILITILEDGTIKTETDRISAANHQSAATFLAEMARLAGGSTEVVRRDTSRRHHQHQVQVHDGGSSR
jgi:hypothetical protein